jgi:hypothetical protein
MRVDFCDVEMLDVTQTCFVATLVVHKVTSDEWHILGGRHHRRENEFVAFFVIRDEYVGHGGSTILRGGYNN